MKALHLLDTSALLAHLFRENGADKVAHCMSPEGGRAAITVVSWVEFQLFLNRSDYSKTDISQMTCFYREVFGSPLPIDDTVGKTAIALRAVLSHRIHLTDLLIAACAKAHAMTLVYRDKHIEGIPQKILSQIKLPSKTKKL